MSTTSKPALPLRTVARAVQGMSSALLVAERLAVTGFMFLLTTLVLLNVVTRYAGRPIYWVDEACIYSVVWLTFIGASAMTRMRLDFAVGMLTEKLSPVGQARAKVVATLAVIGFALMLGWMCWLWLDPVGFAAAGFDARKFAASSFNFIYTERTQTLGWPNWLFYLIMPIFALCLLIHGLANLVEDLGLQPPAHLPALAAATPPAGQTGAVT